MPPVEASIRVDQPPQAAFRLFAEDLGRWWPLAYTYSGPDFAGARIEPRAGGRWLEVDRDGREASWGEVRAYEPDTRLVLAFNVGADRRPEPPERCSEVEVRFLPDGEGTRVQLEHRDFERHGEGEAIRAGMGSPQGWPLILAEFAREAGRRAGP